MISLRKMSTRNNSQVLKKYTFPNHVNKSLQASKAWYERLSTFLIGNYFKHEKVYTTLFHKDYSKKFFIIQI